MEPLDDGPRRLAAQMFATALRSARRGNTKAQRWIRGDSVREQENFAFWSDVLDVDPDVLRARLIARLNAPRRMR